MLHICYICLKKNCRVHATAFCPTQGSLLAAYTKHQTMCYLLAVACPVFTPLIYTRDPRPPISPRIMAPSAMGFNFGVFKFLPTTQAKISAKQMRSQSLHAVRHFVLVCFHPQISVHAGNIIYAPDTPQIFHLQGKNLKIPKFSLMSGSRWCRLWDLWCISMFYTKNQGSILQVSRRQVGSHTGEKTLMWPA